VKDIETVLVVGAFIARIPLVDKLAIDPFEIHTGDLVKVDADGETVMITKQRK
jgi:predicted aconitase with swiveling domain